MLYTGIIMADLHWGAIDPKRFADELDATLFKVIKDIMELEFIVISGDLFDSKEYLPSETTKYVLIFLNKLIKETEKFNTEILIIEGTRGHDSLQSKTLGYIFNSITDISRIKFFPTVAKYNHPNGEFKCLMIPEEYVVDQDEYYKDHFNDHYDMIFGHGMPDTIWYAKKNEQLALYHAQSAPIFKVDELCGIGNYCYFGHVHINKAYGPDKRYKSIGPMTRWEFGTDKCGFYIVTYDTVSQLCNEIYVENTSAQKLGSVAVTIDNDMDVVEASKLITDALEKPMRKYDKIQFIVNLNPSIEHYESIRNMIQAKLGVHKNVKPIIRVMEPDEEKVEETIRQKKEENLYLYGRKNPPEHKIQEFILRKMNKKIDLDTIRETIGLQGDEYNEASEEE